jgi:hypothetical protein
MVRASIGASPGHDAGETFMKIFAITLAALVAAIPTSGALAQSAPVRGVGLLALNASEVHSSPGDVSGGRGGALIETPDGGGGGMVGARASRGSGDARNAAPAAAPEAADALPPKNLIAPGDPTAPAAMAPKRVNYRWQALVPGAIK